jgi:hypothetical protein
VRIQQPQHDRERRRAGRQRKLTRHAVEQHRADAGEDDVGEAVAERTDAEDGVISGEVSPTTGL